MKFRNATNETTILRGIVALLLGAIVGAFLMPLMSTVLQMAIYSMRGAGGANLPLEDILMMIIFGSLIWLAGLVVLGVPAWLVMHFKGYRTWASSVTLGAILPFVTIFTLQAIFLPGPKGSSSYSRGGQQILDGALTPFGWYTVFTTSLTVAGAGMFVALLIWYIAYRPAASERAPINT